MAKHSYRWVEPVVYQHDTIKDVILTTIEGGLSGMMVLDEERHVVGLLTSRDLLRIIALGIKEEESNDKIFSRIVGDYMTPISQVIYGRPEETVGMVRTIMAKLGIKCLPILSRDGRVEGLITARDMSDFGLTAKDKGGKQSYLNDVSSRVGLSSNTSMADPPQYLRAHLALEQTPLFVNVGHAALPHPFKTADGMSGRSLRDIRRPEYATDVSLSEDAYFIARVRLPDETSAHVHHHHDHDHTTESNGNSNIHNVPGTSTSTPTTTLRPYTYFGVADGVGSWREYGVDPRDFSHKLMSECENILNEACHDRQHHPHTVRLGKVDGSKFRQVISPAEIIAQAYERVKADNIIGSATACVALFDGVRHQLHFSNLGDSGLIVLRHIDSDVAGALRREKQKPRTERTSDLRLAFVSQQQLRSFNHPFQLGWTGQLLPNGEASSFREARDACTSSIHVRRGDIIILATDGLFDNVDTDDICAICLDWEQQTGMIRGGDIVARERRWSMGNSLTTVSAERISDLANALVQKARENSLRKDVDSPFAILAKENDVMWSGGMPDDCTCSKYRLSLLLFYRFVYPLVYKNIMCLINLLSSTSFVNLVQLRYMLLV
jgi:protein phosphatase PTC7